MDALKLPVEDHLAKRQEDRAQGQDHVAGQDRGAGLRRLEELAAEEQKDSAEAEHDATQRGGGHPVAGHQEVGEEDDVDGIRIEEHRGMARGRQPNTHVEEAELGREEDAEPEERPALAGPEAKRCSRPQAPREDAHATDSEPERGQHERRRIHHADLDRHGVAAPKRGEQQDHGDGTGVEIARCLGRGRHDPRQCTLGRRETRHHRIPRQRKDHAVQSPHRCGGRRRPAAGPGPAQRRRRARPGRPGHAALGPLPTEEDRVRDRRRR